MKHNKYRNQIFYIAVAAIAIVVTSSFMEDTVSNKRFSKKRVCSILADSSFVPNANEGWDVYTSYFDVQNDSVTVELILSRQLSSGIDWKLTTIAGTIAPLYSPVHEQSVTFREPNRNWSMIIKPDGKCFLRLIDGVALSGNAIVLPVKVTYKK